jgi:hypothetical protein
MKYILVRCIPVRCTFMRYTFMRHPPTIALVAPWPKRWSISQDLSYKIRVFTLVTGVVPIYAPYT